MDRISYGGWKNCYRLANRAIELVVTGDVGPRVIRLATKGGTNLFKEFKEQMGKTGGDEWRIYGGHRLWHAPEAKPRSYQPDNEPVDVRETKNGLVLTQQVESTTGILKQIAIAIDPTQPHVRVTHRLTNRNLWAVSFAPWALSVMAPGGMAIIPLPKKIAHTARLTHVQEWSLWGYTDFADGRWTLGARYLFFRQNRKLGPNKLGIAHREGWVAYQLDGVLFVKRFARQDGATYPDGGVNFETFSNQDFLEMESLGPLIDLAPGKTVKHEETWSLHRQPRAVRTEKDADKYVRPRVG